MMMYCYYISLGLASLHKITSDGNDVDQKPIKIGKFKNNDDAKNACITHYNKCCKMAFAAGREVPKIMFV